ncbi:MAG: amidohydrolase family protein [Bacteroidota bacterium]
MKHLISTLFGLLICAGMWAQETYPSDQVYDKRDGYYAFTNATIYTSYNSKIENATLVIKHGKVEAVGTDVSVPAGAVKVDLDGKYIYPSFIDIYSNYGLPKPKSVGERPERQPQEHSNKKGAYAWNEALKPEFNAKDVFTKNGKTATAMRKIGFGTVVTHQQDGIARGASALVTLSDEKENELILNGMASNHFSFKKGTSTQNYPTSLMGAIALLRQTYYDADWYQSNANDEEYNISLEAWNGLQDIPQVFEVRDRLEALRAAKIGKEFGIQYIFKGAGDEYQRIDELKATGSSFIVSLKFPDAYDVSDPFEARNVTLAQMKHWELAPGNAAVMAKAGIEFALTTDGHKKKSDFMGSLKKAIKNGLSREMALKALTHTPANLMKADEMIGSLAKGKIANFIITSGDVFGEKTTIHHNWIMGKAFILSPLDYIDLTGKYALEVNGTTYEVAVKGKAKSPKMTYAKNDSTDINITHSLSGNVITLSFRDMDDRPVQLAGLVQDEKWSGNGTMSDGSWASWTATYQGEVEKEEKKDDKKGGDDKKKDDGKNTGKKTDSKSTVTFPFVSFGNEEVPTQKDYLIKNATVWTNESDGIIENTDVLVENGKIVKIGKNLSAKNATVVDGTGKHLTSGIIDEHSHIAISRGVNEASQSSSAEVSIADVVNSEDVGIYRSLAGGVTAAQLLHGSANPIGGQSAIIKLRWGYAPEDMKINGAAPFIKFALGENVKQSNWGDDNRSRFPQSRMGVEQVYFDNFTRAREYGEAKKAGEPMRQDIELETLLQIIESERFITCHSYVQSEINMLMKTAEAFGFRVNTFTHILEGYKVADKMHEHGVGGSTFSDWWAYKYEVIDAIPQNAAILHNQGVVTAINSDSREMIRRLNQEAAKSVMYADMSEEDAWKLVTLNAAKLLHLDDRMGSIKVGKDADLVVWSHNPLSIYAKAENTFVDGIMFYSLADNEKKQKAIAEERSRLIAKMLNAKNKGGRTQKPSAPTTIDYHCDTVHDEMQD